MTMSPTTSLAAGAALALGLACNLSAQGLLPTTSFPSDHAYSAATGIIQGSSSNTNLLSGAVNSRSMMIYETFDLKNITAGQKISHVGFQENTGAAGKGYGLLMDVFVGPATVTSKTASATFAANFSSPATQVFGSVTTILKLPDQGQTANPTFPFVWVPFDTPYTFTSAPSLVVDFQIKSNQNGNKAFSYYLDNATFISIAEKAGAGCIVNGKEPLMSNAKTAIGTNWYPQISSATAQAPCVLAISLSLLTSPISWPAPNCRLYLDPATMIPMVFLAKTNTSGSYRWTFPVPDDPIINDFTLYTQGLFEDIWIPSGRATTSAFKTQFGMKPRSAWISNSGRATMPTTGYVYRNYGMITHFIHK